VLHEFLLNGCSRIRASCIASILVAAVVRRTTVRLSTVGFALIIAANALDRIRLGAVIGIFNASKLCCIWIFNVADASTDIGVALLLAATFPTGSDTGWSSRHTT